MDRILRELTFQRINGFQCTGNDCLDHCCQAGFWEIDVDKDTYEFYKTKFDDGEVGRLFKNNIEKTGGGVYRMIPAKDSNCPFLDADRLCKIQKKYGSDKLSYTCKQFPRLVNVYGHYLQIFLNLSCPVAADMIINNEEIIKPIPCGEVSMEENEYNELNQYTAKTDVNINICLSIRDACIDIVSVKNVPLPAKAFYICTMLDSLDKIKNEARFNNLASDMLRTYKDNAANANVIREILTLRDEKVKEKRTLLPLLLKLLTVFLKSNAKSNGLNREFYDRIQARLSRPSSLSAEEIIKHKESAVEDFIRQNEFVMINYLIHNMLINRFPSEGASLAAAGFKTFLEFILIEYFIAFVYSDVRELKMNQVINCIYYFTKLHNEMSNESLMMEIMRNNMLFDFSLLVTV